MATDHTHENVASSGRPVLHISGFAWGIIATMAGLVIVCIASAVMP